MAVCPDGKKLKVRTRIIIVFDKRNSTDDDDDDDAGGGGGGGVRGCLLKVETVNAVTIRRREHL